MPQHGCGLHHGDPYGTRTRVFAVRGRRPRPLDEGAAMDAEARIWGTRARCQGARQGQIERGRPGFIQLVTDYSGLASFAAGSLAGSVAPAGLSPAGAAALSAGAAAPSAG